MFEKIKKNKWIVAAVVAVIIIVAGAILVTVNNAKKTPVTQETNEDSIVNMKPEDIGLTLTPSSDNKELELHIGDVSKFSEYDYTVSYDAVEDGQTVEKGVIGSGKINSGDTSVDKSITLGTCSSGTCRYDKGIKKIEFDIKLQLKNGKTGAVETTVDL
jgi:hypothetical protein